MRHDYLAGLRAFHAIARHASFTRAAAELEVSPSALSQTVRQLEERLGVRLLQRSTRRVALTEAGRQLLARSAPAVADIDEAVEALRQADGRPSGTLRIGAARMVFDHLIAPHASAFLRAYPEVKLELVAEDRLVDLIGTGLDAAVRLGERLARDVVAVPLSGPMRSVVVGSPDYFARHGRPRDPHELQRHLCARFRFPGSGAVYQWEFAHPRGPRRGRWFDIDVGGPLTVNTTGPAIQAALDGFVLAHVLEPEVRAHVAAGRLETVLDAWLPPYEGFYLYYSSRLQVPPKLRAFADFMRARLEPPRRSGG